MPSSTWKRVVGPGVLLFAYVTPTLAASMPVPRQSSINWFACPDSDTTQCAFFDVPMDYSDPLNNATVSIFMRKLPATVPSAERLGSIIVNNGANANLRQLTRAQEDQRLGLLRVKEKHTVEEIPRIEEQLLTISWVRAIETCMKVVGGRYDIIGFDPRGVNLTGPPTGCFDNEAKYTHAMYRGQVLGLPFPHLGGDSERSQVALLAAQQATLAAACVRNGNHQMLQSVGTVAVVRDMEKMVEALGEDGLNYWGYSYGGALGATFAALRPKLVKRMVLDGPVDPESYFNDALRWGRDSMRDTNKVLTGFLSTCIEVGPERCVFAAPKGNSSKAETVSSLRKRLDSLYKELEDRPLVVDDSSAGPGIFRPTELQALLVMPLRSPAYWTTLAQELVQLEQGNGSAAYSRLYGQFYTILPRSYIENVYNRPMQMSPFSEALFTISCSDGAELKLPLDDYTRYARELGELSPIGESWASIVLGCHKWPFKSRERYRGPWSAKDGLKRTRFPILLIGMDADPVTPLATAIKLGRGFGEESATVLIQKGYGHTSLAQPSSCVYKSVYEYFVDGKVPVNGTNCASDPGFLFPVTAGASLKRGTGSLGGRDEDLQDAAVRL